ncbi:MAG: glycoside hydrolase family 44 protein, partial [Halanaerobiaceae bacterium]
MKKKFFVTTLILLVTCIFWGSNFALAGQSIDFEVDTDKDVREISPYIYGVNYHRYNDNEDSDKSSYITSCRIGGNRLTGYNWENNASNAGEDWEQSSDDYLVMDLPEDRQDDPAALYTNFQNTANEDNIDYSLFTVQMAGYVAADMDGSVSEEETAPSDRWKEVKFRKDDDFSLEPDIEDDYVYMDEMINFLVDEFGTADSDTGIEAYSLDNEPSLWPSTHPHMHPDKVSCEKLIEKSSALASAVKDVDSEAEIFGPALYGFAAFLDLQSAPDWEDDLENDYQWFIDYYLDSMHEEEDRTGRRLLDVLDLHWYSEARANDTRIVFSDEDSYDEEVQEARVQAPRMLWDPDYEEDSWIGDSWTETYRPIIPRIKESIETYYPETKLAFTEYGHGAEGHISGGIAQADTLGIFGKYGVYLATLWGSDSEFDYAFAAHELYRNYDGNGGKFGNTHVYSSTQDKVNSSIYTSTENEDDDTLHMMVINKNSEESIDGNFEIDSNTDYNTGEVYGFDSSSPDIEKMESIETINSNNFEYEIPPYTVSHIILKSDDDSQVVKGDVNGSGEITSNDFAY